MWVSNTGRFHTNEELAAILRDATGSIQVVMSSACSLSMSKRLSAMTWRQRGDDSDIFTVEVGVLLKETPYMMVLEVAVDPVNELVTIKRSRA